MDRFLLENAERYNRLAAAVQPPKPEPSADVDVDKDTTINIRIRPILDEDEAAHILPAVVERKGAHGLVDMHELRRPPRGLPTLKSSFYKVDRVFGPTISSEQIYAESIQPLVPRAWAGDVSTVFAYGQTGSGKTFTTSALQKRIAQELFSGTLEGQREIFISFIELVGNSAFDLLNQRNPVALLEDSFGLVRVNGGLDKHVTDAEALLDLIETANTFRLTAKTQKNDASSRSHAICKLRFADNDTLPEDGLLYLVDLAGSEAARDVTDHPVERFKETKEINISHSVLKACIRGRATLNVPTTGKGQAKPYIPFRQSALTKYLKHVFDPDTERNCRTVFMACVNPGLLDTGASRNTMRYAELLRVDVPRTTVAAFDSTKPSTWSNSELREWITANSGTPPISSAHLAPLETGTQLINLPENEFLSRCMKTPGVTADRAVAFRAKLWRLHVDSRHPLVNKPPTENIESQTVDVLSSRDTRPEMDKLPFKQRIQPGMVVSWTPATDDAQKYVQTEDRNLALVMSPEVVDLEGAGGMSYRCATIRRGAVTASFVVHVWCQVVVPVSRMEAEVLMQYDPASRYYYESV